MNTFEQVSDQMATVVQTTGASVVRVEGRRRFPATGIVYAADGVIVTSHHGVTRDENIHVGLADGSHHEATLIGRDPRTDIALLRITASDLSPATWADIDGASVGQFALALGRPGQHIQAALGIISALGDEWKTHSGAKVDRYVRPDVTMYPGFSGGPLVGADGSVWGMNTSAMMRGSALTLPAATIERIVSALLKHGHIKRGYLGITAQAARLNNDYAKENNQETGLLIASVEEDSPAAAAGMMLGDVLVQLNGAATPSMEALFVLLSDDVVGTSVEAVVLRGGQPHALSVTVGER